MAYKRLIAMVPVLGGQVVLSYGYARHRPAGTLKTVLRNLDRWGVDEIAVVDISKNLERPDVALLEQVRRAAIRTPVAFGGGIRTTAQAVQAVSLGCDRVIVEKLIWDAPAEVTRISAAIGQQAVIGAVPCVVENGAVWAAPARGPREPWKQCLARLQNLQVSELLLIDRAHEGAAGSHTLATHMPPSALPQKLIWFGGLDAAQAALCLARGDTVGAAFGNPFLVTELAAHHARQAIRDAAGARILREVQPHAEV